MQPHVPSVATCIVIAYRVQFEHHKPLAGREGKVDNLGQDLLLERFD